MGVAVRFMTVPVYKKYIIEFLNQTTNLRKGESRDRALTMVGRSDIEEIEIDDGNIFDADDSASNLSEPRQLRRRKSKQDSSKDPTEKMEKLKITATTSRQKKRLMDKEREEFLNEFDQTTSERERRKNQTKEKIRESTRGRGKGRVYDDKGILVSCKKDLCDCMDDTCPGCHFPCPKCRSNKCGHECRQNRKWIFDCVELDGMPGSLKENPYAKEFQTPK